jgi:hypothetical protein
MASNGFGEETAELGDEPVARGYMATGSQPKLRVEGEEVISGVKIREEMVEGVGGGGDFLNEDGVAFPGTVTLVRG